MNQLVHACNEVVDEDFTVTTVTAFGEVVGLLLPAAGWVGKLEWPEEVGDGLEVWTRREDLVHDVFNANYTLGTESSLDDSVIGQWGSGLVHFAVSSLVNHLSDSLKGWISVCDVWFDHSDHVHCGLVNLNEDCVVDLEQSEELQNLSHFWCHCVNTLDTDDKCHLWHLLDIEGASGSCLSLETDGVPLGLSVFSHIRFGTLEDNLSVCLGSLLGLGESSCLLGGVLLGGLPLLEKGLWDFWESGKIGEQARDR